MIASRAFDLHSADSRARATSPYLDVSAMTKRAKVSARVAGEMVQLSQCSERLISCIARHEDRAERAALAAAEDAAAAADPARDWLRPKEVALLLGLSANSVRRMATRRYDPLPARRPSGGDGWLQIPLAELLAYQADHGWSAEALAALAGRARALLAAAAPPEPR